MLFKVAVRCHGDLETEFSVPVDSQASDSAEQSLEKEGYAPSPGGQSDAEITPPAIGKTLLPTPAAIWFWSHARRVAIFVIGVTILILGGVMLVIPGPGLLTIAAGLALLATEFAWARWTVKHAEERIQQILKRIHRSNKSNRGCNSDDSPRQGFPET